MRKATVVVTPLYISIAWTLMVSYQLFTQIAVTTVITHINIIWPSIGALLSFRTDMLVLIYAFAWVFLLSSVIPSVILGKERGVLVQFFVCLTLTLVAFAVQNVLTTFGSRPIDQLFSLAASFHNPFLATAYLLIPYLLMLMLDIRSRKRRKGKEPLKKLAGTYSDDAATGNQNAQQDYSPTPT
jgi:hypothetical protein